jgi:hypothetical protein
VSLLQGAIEPWRPESHDQNEVVIEAAVVATGRFARDFAAVEDGVVGPWYLDTFLRGSGLDALDDVVLSAATGVASQRKCDGRLNLAPGTAGSGQPFTALLMSAAIFS